MKNNKYTVSDFFCGAGGWSEGFRQKGFDMVFSLDHWKPAVDTHLLNHPECICIQKDILEFDSPEKIDELIPDTDIIVGSPPCVSFSHSNKAGKADKSLGISLIETFLRIVLWKQSKGNLKYWAMENVPNSEPYVQDKYTWKELGLPGEGPDLEIPTRKVLVASDYGAAQNRKRFVCGDFPLPKKTHEGKEMLIENVFNNLGNPLKERKTDIIDPTYSKFKLKSNEVYDHFYDTRIPEFEWKKAKRLKEDHGYMGKMDFPERTNRTCRTVMATQSASTREAIIFPASKDSKGNWKDFRLPTIREISTFMGFPINYQFEGNNEGVKYKLVGNAVCPPMSAAIASAILEKENIKNPGFIPLKLNQYSSLNLNGREKKEKIQNSKKMNAKYSRHVPYLKSASLRVELSNRESHFESENYIWTSKLHWGSGKAAIDIKIENDDFIESIESYDNFSRFNKELNNLFNSKIYSNEELQKRFCLISTSNHYSPDNLLEDIKKLIENIYPEDHYGSEFIENNTFFKDRKNEIPVRIIMAYYALNKAISLLN
jgi:DNA (cytosine-5)-methyltransferase 1